MENFVLSHLEPKGVFRFFEELARVPHGSGNTAAASAWDRRSPSAKAREALSAKRHFKSFAAVLFIFSKSESFPWARYSNWQDRSAPSFPFPKHPIVSYR